MSTEKEELLPARPKPSRIEAAQAQQLESTVDFGDPKTGAMSIPRMSGFRTIEIVGRLVFAIMMKFWALCTTALLILLLLFWLYGGFVAFSLLTVAVIGFLYNAQDQLLYYPDQPQHARFYVELPSVFELPYENIFVKARDGVKINMFLIKQPPHLYSKAYTVIYLHGNAGNIGHRLMNAHAMHSFTGANILLVEYRGYGKSEGSPNENGLYLDAQAAFDFLLQRTDIDHSKIIIFGRSLGGAIAIHLAEQPYYAKQAFCLIVENTFTTLPHIARQLFGSFKIVTYLPSWCYKNKYNSLKRISKVRIPTLFISGLSDSLIPPRMMHILFETSGSLLKRLARFESGTHNETWQCSGYYETMNRYLVEVADMDKMGSQNSSATYSTDLPFDDSGRGGGMFSV